MTAGDVEDVVRRVYASAGIAAVDPGAMAYWRNALMSGDHSVASMASSLGVSALSSDTPPLTRLSSASVGPSGNLLGAVVLGGQIIEGIGRVAGGIKDAFSGGRRLPPQPGYGSPPAPPSLPGGRQPEGGFTGTIKRLGERIIPGGRSGRELMPYEGTERDRMGRPIAVYPDKTERLYAPPGYVIVNMGTAEKPMPLAVLKGVARSMGLWKGRPKPPISGYDARAIKRAAAAQKRVKRLAGDVGLRMALPVAGKGRFGKRKAKR